MSVARSLNLDKVLATGEQLCAKRVPRILFQELKGFSSRATTLPLRDFIVHVICAISLLWSLYEGITIFTLSILHPQRCPTHVLLPLHPAVGITALGVSFLQDSKSNSLCWTRP